MALNTAPTLLMGEPERTEEHTRGTRARGRRRQARCQCRRTEPEALKYIINRDVEGDILIFLNAYKTSPYEYVEQFLKTSNTKYEMVDDILWMFVYQQRERENVKESIKLFIEGNCNIKKTPLDILISF